MKSFKISTYNISSTRLTGKQKVTFAILADLHGLVFGKNHQTLYKAIIASQPDAVLVCGDQTMKNCLHLPAFVFFTMNIHLFS